MTNANKETAELLNKLMDTKLASKGLIHIGRVTSITDDVDMSIEFLDMPEPISISWSEGMLLLYGNNAFAVNDLVALFPVNKRYLVIGPLQERTPITRIIQADESSLFIRVDGDTISSINQVEIGVDDSGGAGYRLLRVVN